MDCKWGRWQIGKCSQTCGGGVKTNTRDKIQEDLFGGIPCEGESTFKEDCNTQGCPGKTLVKIISGICRGDM